jgi:hypothetical protein
VIDPAAVKAAHYDDHICTRYVEGSPILVWYVTPHEGKRCLLYLLADALEAERAKVARLQDGIGRALALASNPAVDHGARSVAMKHELAALADQPEQKVPGVHVTRSASAYTVTWTDQPEHQET